MNAFSPAHVACEERDPVLERAAASLVAEIKSTSAQLEDAKAEASRLIGDAAESGAIADSEGEELIRSHRLRPRPYRSPVDVLYAPAFERGMVEEIDVWDRFLIREHLRLGSITRSQAETFFVRLGFDPGAL